MDAVTIGETLHQREIAVMGFETRRVVTGHDAAGCAVVRSDQRLFAQPVAHGGAWFNMLWATSAWPADNTDETDGARRDTGLSLDHGSVLRVVDMAPGHRSPMHRTQSLDYGIVLSGEVDLELDGGLTTRLHAGDIVIQRGTLHAWINPGSQPARVAFVLLGAAPLTIAGRELAPVA
ncbi:MAG TPA: cupin domain-containing protein [Steroidobacteraceae bacterium]